MLNCLLKAWGLNGSPSFLWATRISLSAFCMRRISGTFLVFSLSSFLVQYAVNYILDLKIFRFIFVVYVLIFGDLVLFKLFIPLLMRPQVLSLSWTRSIQPKFSHSIFLGSKFILSPYLRLCITNSLFPSGFASTYKYKLHTILSFVKPHCLPIWMYSRWHFINVPNIFIAGFITHNFPSVVREDFPISLLVYWAYVVRLDFFVSFYPCVTYLQNFVKCDCFIFFIF